jgi:hypothetical protein
MKLKDIVYTEEEVFKEKVIYATNRIADIEEEIGLHKNRIKELQAEIKMLNETDLKKIKVPFEVDAIWLGSKRLR